MLLNFKPVQSITLSNQQFFSYGWRRSLTLGPVCTRTSVYTMRLRIPARFLSLFLSPAQAPFTEASPLHHTHQDLGNCPCSVYDENRFTRAYEKACKSDSMHFEFSEKPEKSICCVLFNENIRPSFQHFWFLKNWDFLSSVIRTLQL